MRHQDTSARSAGHRPRRHRLAPTPSGPADVFSPRLEHRCSGCDGTGELDGEAWEAWETEQARLLAMSADSREQPVLREVIDRLVHEHEGRRPAEPRETACPDCDGTGTVPTREGQELLAFLRRHLGD